MAGANDEFIAVIQAAVQTDPDNVALRIDLVELMLQSDPPGALAQIAELERLGANTQTVQVLRARAAAAQLRSGAAAPADVVPPASAAEAGPEAGPAEARPAEREPGPAEREPEPRPASVQDVAPRGVPAGPAAPTEAQDPPSDAERAPVGVSGEEELPVWDVERPAVTLADVAGLAEVKGHLEAAFLAPLRNPELARMFGKSAGGSLLMYGPPGCGKTFIARAIAGELGAGFVHATLADLMGQYFGQSEKALHQLFETARASRPCVIFLDEFDAIGGRRSSGGASAQSLRMVTSQLLEELDGVRAANDGIYVLAATNRPWDIDPALRRPGRLDRTVLILPPDEPARAAIVRGRLRDKPAAAVDADAIAARTAEFSGADLTYVVDTAVQQAFVDSMRDGVPRMIDTNDLLRATGAVVPSTRSWFEQVAPVLEYGVDDGTFAQLKAYLRKHRIR
ncbi:ATP-binding protein [Microbacterium marinilacus]|uniref:AAA+ ATPase domain-containing protein n=1 Tax=Microbacterium marinilacus TaxID=415209 RepID=A0ABP7BX56_9MICO|nr:ATP-binding protein [Microbacterium marinilacus]MBY0688191.1 AAA family ATPase [Microbacterium marinilacus]